MTTAALAPVGPQIVALPEEVAAYYREIIGQYVEASEAANTRRTYRAAWASFERWCSKVGSPCLPAAPAAVAAYLAHLGAQGRKPGTLNVHASAIAHAHRVAGLPTPTDSREVKAVLSGIRRLHGTKPRRVEAATMDVLSRMVEALPAGLKGLRDRALLLTGFGGAFRRSELVAIEVEDLAFTAEGLVVTVRRSKTDQEGAGAEVAIPYHSDPALCPVRALQNWLEAAGVSDGLVFRSVDRHGNLRGQGLHGRDVARIVKAAAERAGEDPAEFSGHSLRAGLATSAVRGGASRHALMAHGRWSSNAVDRYVRERDRWRDNAAAAAFQGI